MENEMTKTQQEPLIKRVEIRASCELWTKFEERMRVQGYQTLPEAFRAAMREVTNFNRVSQQQTS